MRRYFDRRFFLLVPVKTLRYDQIKLLKPAHVDKFSSYRYYMVDQMPRLNRILALKDLNFTLDQIARMLDDSLTPEQMRGMLRLKQAEIERNLDEEQAWLRRIESRLRQIV
jgi:DNA-binding transcriptional MerR regulator